MALTSETVMRPAADQDLASERKVLRELAKRVRAIADQPVMSDRRELWRRHNSLRPQRPLVLCFPEGAWSELLPDASLMCHDQRHRRFEQQLRTRIYWWEHLNDDNTIEPWFDLPWKLNPGDYGVPIPYHHGDNRGSYVWDPPIKDLENDFRKLHFRNLHVDREGSLRDLAYANDVFGDVLPARIHGDMWWSLGPTRNAALLIGLDNLMWAMYDQPQALHRLMAFLRDECLNFLNWVERQGLLTSNTGANDYVGSGGVGLLPGELEPVGPVTLAGRWGFAEAQETVGVSPAMFEEFVLPYQVPLLEKFKLNCYGCCEGLEHRIDALIQHVPRLRRVSVAPNANQQILAQKLGRDYVYSRKPYPAHVCVGFNEPAIRQDLRDTLILAGRGPLELIMKDTHTVQNEPSRLTRWIQLAREEIETYMAGPRA